MKFGRKQHLMTERDIKRDARALLTAIVAAECDLGLDHPEINAMRLEPRLDRILAAARHKRLSRETYTIVHCIKTNLPRHLRVSLQ
jgi:hypothetical protein